MRPKSTTRAPTDSRADDALRLRLVLEPPHTVEMSPIPLAPGRICLGSGPDCDVTLNVRGVAERHCLIVAGPARTVVKALSPLTWINDGPARETPLRSGDRLAIGPLEFRVRGPFPSELPAFESPAQGEPQPRSHSPHPLWNEAFAHRKLSQAAAAARRELAERAEWTTALPGVGFNEAAAVAPVSPPDHSAVQREYLARLAETLTAREVELTARDADLRCRWEELQLGLADCHAAERAVRSQRQELARREADQDAGRAQLESERSSIHSQFSELEARQRELAAEAASLHAERDRLRQWDERLQQDASALQAREQASATEQVRLSAERERTDRLATELDSQAEALRHERLALETARSAWTEEQQQRADAGDESARRNSLLTEREQALEHREQELASAQAALECAQAAAQAAEKRFDAEHAELRHRSAELDQERLDLETARDAILLARADLDVIRAECEVRQAALDRLNAELADREAGLASASASDAPADADYGVPPDLNEPATGELGVPDLAFEREQVAAEHERLNFEREQLIAEQSRLDADRQELLALRQSLDVEQLQAEWAQLSQARRELEDERAVFHRQLQEFAASTSVKAIEDDTPAVCDVEPVAEPLDDALPSGDAALADDAPELPPEAFSTAEASDWSPDTHAESASQAYVAAPASLPEHWETLHAELTSCADVGEESWIRETPAAEADADADADAFSYSDHADVDDDRPPEAWRPSETPGNEGETPAETDPLLSLRSRLAELFGIASLGQPAAESPAGSESAVDHSDAELTDVDGSTPEADLTAARYIESDPEAGDEEVVEAPVSTEPESAPSLTAAVAAMPAPEGDGDSISSYMERLIARSRKPAEDQPAAKAETQIRPTSPPAPVVDTVEKEPECAADERPTQSKNLTPPDKELLRANLDSFRELANISARSAVAKHESKKLHSVVQFKLIMLAMSVGLCLALWAANLMNRGSYVPYAVAAGIASLVMAAEVGRTLLAFYRWKSVESIGQWDDEDDEPTVAGDALSETPADDEQAVPSGS